MSIAIRRKLLFFIDKEKNDNNSTKYKPDGQLRLRIRYTMGKVDFNVGYRVVIEKWNKETQRCNTNTTHGKKKILATEINKEIQRLENLANDIFRQYEIKEYTPTPAEYRGSFNEANDKELGKEVITKESFFHIFDLFIKDCGMQNNWTKATYQKFSAVRNHLFCFDSNLSFTTLNDIKLIEYVNYLRDRKNMRNSTIGKQIGFLKWFLRWSSRKGHNNNNAIEGFKPKLKTAQKKVVFLTWKEINQLQNYQIPKIKKYLERVRDVFLFTCFTGLRYSDVSNLKWGDIKDNYIEITTIKTADTLKIDLNKFSRSILNKYKDVHFENNKILPVISNQKMNDYLKELGGLAGLNEPITEIYKGNGRIENTTPKYTLLGTHAGRKTFICNSLTMGIPAQTVMKWTGHSDCKAMKPYVDIADKDRMKAMEIWNRKEILL